MENKIIKFARTISSRLEYWINATALVILPPDHNDCIRFRIQNSRGKETPGEIKIPIEDLPKVIEQLIQVQNELVAAGKLQT